MVEFKAHFDWKVIVPDEPVDLSKGKPLILKVEEAHQEAELKPREFVLFQGRIWLSPDFDDPLPDEFWLGEDA